MALQDPEPLPALSAATMGHLVIGLCQVPLLALVAWVALRVSGVHPASVGEVLLASVLTLAASAVLEPVHERVFQLRAHHLAPGGVLFALGGVVIPVGCALAIGWMESPAWAVVFALAVFVEQSGFVAYMKPWRGGMSMADAQRRVKATREMTHELITESGWTDAAKDQVPRGEWRETLREED